MDFEPSEQAGKQRQGATAIWFGIVLMCVGFARIFILPALIDEKPSVQVKAESVESPVIENQETTISQSQNALPETPKIDNSEQPYIDDKPEEVLLSRTETRAKSVATNSEPVLTTYYAFVLQADGSRKTLTLSANSEDKAREIIRDFRGNPEILHGPALEITW